MATKRQINSEDSIPFFSELEGFYAHIKARPPLHSHFDIREIDPEVLKNYDYVAAPFRHSFYCITLFLGGEVNLNSGFWKTKLTKPALYFKSPFQMVSWMKPEKWLKEYFIVFTEEFLNKNKQIADIVFRLPFFNLEKAVPFEIDNEDVELLTGIYKAILQEYRSDRNDKFDLISSYTHILLLHIRRLYERYVLSDNLLNTQIGLREEMLVQRFRSLIADSFSLLKQGDKSRTVKSFADQLGTHPNHLNAVVKRQMQKTAIALIHEHVIAEARSLLSQTDQNIKTISSSLGFPDPAHFSNFFKKHTGRTPAAYKKEGQL